MKKEIILFAISILVFFISGFSESKTKSFETVYFESNISTVLNEYQLPKETVQIPFVGNSFIGFREALAFKESRGKYNAVNSIGYMGKYQFGRTTLERFKIYDTQKFIKSPELQEEAFIALCSVNKWILRKDIKRSVGKKINGVLITESGILAAAHLSGAGNVKKYLRSNGNHDFSDAYGTTIPQYLRKFAGYDTSIIESNRKPVI